MVEVKECVGLNNCLKRYYEAERVLQILSGAGHVDYVIDDLYENGFSAKRTNEWCKTEMYVEINPDHDFINDDNIFDICTVVTLVVERYK